MGWYDVASTAQSKLNGFFASDLETIYGKIRSVELALLGSYHTTGWGSWGSPSSAGYPHCKINHSVLGSDVNFRDAIDYIRLTKGVPAFNWNLVKVDFRRSPAIPETLRELLFALGRIEVYSTGQWSVSTHSGIVYDADTLTNNAHSALLPGQMVGILSGTITVDDDLPAFQWNTIKTKIFGGTDTSHKTAFGYDTSNWFVDVGTRVYRKWITGAESKTLESVESSNLDSKAFSLGVDIGNEPSLTLPTIAAQDNLGLTNDGPVRTDYGLFVANLEVDSWIECVFFSYEKTTDTNVIEGPTTNETALSMSPTWMSSNSAPSNHSDLSGGDSGTDGEYFWVYCNPTSLQGASGDYQYRSANESWLAQYDDMDADYPIGSCASGDYRSHHIDIRPTYEMEMVGGYVPDGSFSSEAADNIEWIYWTEAP